MGSLALKYLSNNGLSKASRPSHDGRHPQSSVSSGSLTDPLPGQGVQRGRPSEMASRNDLSLQTTPIDADWLSRPSPEVAPDLLGCWLVRQGPTGEIVRSLIVETEAYAPGDPACHAYRRRTPRNAVMFGPAGMAYVYLIYGMYHCFNIVTDGDGQPSAVLLRAVELSRLPSWVEFPPSKSTGKSRAKSSTPTVSLKAPQKWRDRLGAGPGKLCRALDITLDHTAQPLQPASDLWLEHRSPAFQADLDANHLTVTQTTRIGLSQGTDIPWRWYVRDSLAVSKR